MQNIYTILEDVVSVYEEKHSKFFAFAIYVDEVSKIPNILMDFRKKYKEAKHICYAYVVGENGEYTKSTDDGEPAGSAGAPLLACIKSQDLTNVLIVVVRFFGGILLGKSCLLRAYAKSAQNVLLIAKKAVLCQTYKCSILVNYSKFEDIKSKLKKNYAFKINCKFLNDVEISFNVKKDDLQIIQNLCSIEMLHLEILGSEVVKKEYEK